MRKATKKKIWIVAGGAGVVLVLIWVIGIFYSPFYNNNVIFGTSFDPEYAGYLGFDPKLAWNKITGDWGFEYVRLPVHWDKLESVHGRFDWAEMDWYMKDAQVKKLKVILAIGQKTPRWPECYIPAWATQLNREDYKKELQKYLTAVVERYRDNSALEMWQVENEPYLSFGVCPDFAASEFKGEIAAVRTADAHNPILVADSGELATWIFTGRAGDYFGTTIYRNVWDKNFGYFNYDWIPAIFYRAKLALLAFRNSDSAYIVELQAEPWIKSGHPNDVALDEQYKTMNGQKFLENIEFAKKIGLPRAYLWGAEWWYWLESKGNEEMVKEALKLKKN